MRSTFLAGPSILLSTAARETQLTLCSIFYYQDTSVIELPLEMINTTLDGIFSLELDIISGQICTIQ